ncbi:MAG: PIN domain-containing protein [Candidatus Roizmanbacteria bacterium]|nr:PIN domain-containing protein [Candidatus Roizmanbacteria bacterium]
MPIYVTDTHSLIWYLLNSSKLSFEASKAFEEIEAGKGQLVIPAIVIAEIIYLIKRNKIEADINALIQKIQESNNFRISLLNMDTLLCFKEQKVILEMHDSLIICEAIIQSARIITNDKEITNSELVDVIW